MSENLVVIVKQGCEDWLPRAVALFRLGQLSVAMQCRSDKGQFSICFGSEVVHLKSKFCVGRAVAICKNSF